MNLPVVTLRFTAGYHLKALRGLNPRVGIRQQDYPDILTTTRITESQDLLVVVNTQGCVRTQVRARSASR
jgi:hypothetical protein